MSVFTLTISCLTTSNLPWFMDLTFQVPMQFLCLLQHRTLLSPPDTSTTERWFHFVPATSFFVGLLVIALWSSPVVYWTPSNLGGLSSVISFFLFILSLGFSWQEDWSALPFLPPVDHVSSERFTMTHPSWVALHGMAHSFIELCKPLCRDKTVTHEGDVRDSLSVLISQFVPFSHSSCNWGFLLLISRN